MSGRWRETQAEEEPWQEEMVVVEYVTVQVGVPQEHAASAIKASIDCMVVEERDHVKNHLSGVTMVR